MPGPGNIKHVVYSVQIAEITSTVMGIVSVFEKGDISVFERLFFRKYVVVYRFHEIFKCCKVSACLKTCFIIFF